MLFDTAWRGRGSGHFAWKRFDNQHRIATEWTDSINVRSGSKVEPRPILFRKTHHGPLVTRVDDSTYLAANVAGIFDLNRFSQNYAAIFDELPSDATLRSYIRKLRDVIGHEKIVTQRGMGYRYE